MAHRQDWNVLVLFVNNQRFSTTCISTVAELIRKVPRVPPAHFTPSISLTVCYDKVMKPSKLTTAQNLLKRKDFNGFVLS